MNATLSAVQAMLLAVRPTVQQYVGFTDVDAVPCLVIEALPQYTYSRSGYADSFTYTVTYMSLCDKNISLAANIAAHAQALNNIVSDLRDLAPANGYIAQPTYNIDKQIELDSFDTENDNYIYGYFSISGGLS